MDAQPEPIREYTDRLEIASTNRIPKFNSMNASAIGIGIHRRRAKIKASIGAKKNNCGMEEEGLIGSLINNFTPSAIGWSRP